MSLAQLQITLTFKVTYCCDEACATPIVMPTEVYNRFLNDTSQWFFCPFGHKQHFTGPTEEEKLRKQLDAERQSKEWWVKKAEQNEAKAKRSEKSAIAFKGQVTRIRNRVKNGVCPCCHRTFQNLRQHMETKHPGFGSEQPKETDE